MIRLYSWAERPRVKVSSVLAQESPHGADNSLILRHLGPKGGSTFTRIQSDNRSTADNWTLYTSHRQAVHRVLESIARQLLDTGPVDLTVLGAGNCNDVDLRLIAEIFDDIRLIDVDEQAIADAVKRQGVKSARFDIIGGINIADSASFAPRDARKPSVVLSATVLSQLVNDVLEIEPVRGDQSIKRVVEMRSTHFQLMERIAGPGGVCILINDLVSSQTVPSLPIVDASKLGETATACVASGNFFTGCNPFAIVDQILKNQNSSSVDLIHPWIWRMASDVWRLCYGVVWRPLSRPGHYAGEETFLPG